MKFENLKITILNQADRSDPLNMLVVVGARATVDGVECGWRGTAVNHNPQNVLEGLEIATAFLIKQILKKPRNDMRLSQPDSSAFTFEIPDVEIG